MANGTNGNGKGFKGGGLTTGVTGMAAMALFLLNKPYWIQASADPKIVEEVIIFLIDLFLKVSLAVVTGGFLWFAQVLLSDYYEHKLKHRIFKNKNKQNGQSDDKEKAA